MITRVSLYVVAALLIGAHFLRAGNMVLVGLCVAAPLLFFWRHRASLIVLQLFAYLAAWRWIDTALRLVEVREQMGKPWTVAVLILGGVALFTVTTGLLLNARSMRERYSR